MDQMTRTCALLTALFLMVAPAALAQGTGDGTGAVPGVPERIDLSSLTAEVVAPDGPLTVGDRFDLTIRVDLPAGVVLSGVDSVNIGRLEAVDSHVAPSANGQPATVTLAFVSYRAGTHAIEAFDISVLQPDGSTERVRIPGLDVSVQSVIANEQDPQLRPEKDGVPIQYRDYTWAWAAGIGAGVLLLSTFVFLLARNRPRAIKLPPPLPPRPAHEVAIEKLDAIKQEGLIASGQVMAFHVRLSEAIREYLGLRYGFNGLDLTTTELLAQLDDRRLPRTMNREAIGHQLYACDLVKFAKGGAEATEEEELLGQAYKLVDETTPRAAPEAATTFRPQGAAAGGRP